MAEIISETVVTLKLNREEYAALKSVVTRTVDMNQGTDYEHTRLADLSRKMMETTY